MQPSSSGGEKFEAEVEKSAKKQRRTTTTTTRRYSCAGELTEASANNEDDEEGEDDQNGDLGDKRKVSLPRQTKRALTRLDWSAC